MIPRIFVVPSWLLAIVMLTPMLALGFTTYKWIDAERGLTMCAAYSTLATGDAQKALKTAAECDSRLLTCMVSVRTIADKLNITGVEF